MNKTKPQVYLFTDGSANPQSGVGYGAYLFIDDCNSDISQLEKKIHVKKFNNTSSTKLELETLLWALDEINADNYKIIAYTDCQNIIGLNSRRERFEKNNYMTGKDKLIANHELYKDFYKIVDILDCEFIKIKGHKKTSLKDTIDKIFTFVDNSARNALRKNT